MAVRHGYGKVAGANSLVFAYDIGDTRNSYKGEPTVNYVPGTYNYSLYAYVSGPVDTLVLNEKNQLITVKRYTITNAVNTARAAIYPTGLTTGVAYTLSFKWKYNGSTTISPLVLMEASKGNPEGGANNNSFTSQSTNTINIGSGWYLSTYTFVFSSIPTSACILTFGILTGTTSTYIGETFDIYEAQFEIKDHKTQYSNGTRSSTQGLLDLTGKGTIDLTNTSFDANAQPFFDGVDDRIVVPYSGTDLDGDAIFTVEGIFKRTGTIQYKGFWGLGGDNTAQGVNGYTYNGSGNEIGIDLWGSKTYRTGVDYPLNQYVYVAWVKSAATFSVNTILIYINGVEYTGASLIINRDLAATVNLNTSASGKGISIGRVGPQTNLYHAPGEVPVFKVYNKALTIDEIRNNYRNYKTRFNI